MLDFRSVQDERQTFAELVADLTKEDLGDLTNGMIDGILNLIVDCVDGDVTFQPVDPEAHDPWAVKDADIALAWTLGHVIVHITASAEESAALAAEMARGVKLHGRSRYEVPWESMSTLAMCRQRLEESRRMRLASLDMWPDEPHLELAFFAWKGGPRVNAVGRFVLGLRHTDSHLGQIVEIVRQAREARS